MFGGGAAEEPAAPPPAADVFAEPAAPAAAAPPSAALLEWKAKITEQLRAKEAEEAEEQTALKAQAETDRTAFYTERTKKIEARQQVNRSREDAAAAATFDNTWEAVLDLISLDAKVEGRTDLSRMKSVIFRIKNSPPPKM